MIILYLMLISWSLFNITELVINTFPGWNIKLIKLWLKELIKKPLNCQKCFAFWLSLILTGDLILASLVALIFNVIEKIDNYDGRR